MSNALTPCSQNPLFGVSAGTIFIGIEAGFGQLKRLLVGGCVRLVKPVIPFWPWTTGTSSSDLPAMASRKGLEGPSRKKTPSGKGLPGRKNLPERAFPEVVDEAFAEVNLRRNKEGDNR